MEAERFELCNLHVQLWTYSHKRCQNQILSEGTKEIVINIDHQHVDALATVASHIIESYDVICMKSCDLTVQA